jgi:hypothetical protein
LRHAGSAEQQGKNPQPSFLHALLLKSAQSSAVSAATVFAGV